MLLIFKAAVPVFDNVIVFTELLVPKSWFPKFNELGETLAVAPLFPIPTNSTTCCGLSSALSVTTMLPPRDQAAVGLNVTVIVHDDPAATPPVQLLVCEKSPVTVIALTVNVAVPGLLTVMGFVELLLPTNTPVKLRLAGPTVAAAATPVPLKGTVCGLPVALSLILSEDDRLPVFPGVNVTLIVQLAFTASVFPHVWVCEKYALLPVVILIVVNDRVAVPVLVSVTTCALLLTPTIWLPKLRLVGDSVTTG
jgi:hypothetical protein